jgi:hypothetical protein
MTEGQRRMSLGIPVAGKTYLVVLNVRSGVSRYRLNGIDITLTDFGIVLGRENESFPRTEEKFSDHTGGWTTKEVKGIIFHPWHMVERIEEVTE